MQLEHWPILYAILRPALFSGNDAVRHHMERLAEVLEGDQLAAVRELLDRKPGPEPARVIHSAAEPDAPTLHDADSFGNWERAAADVIGVTASAPALRLLTDAEVGYCEFNSLEATAREVQREFCKVNGLPVPSTDGVGVRDAG